MKKQELLKCLRYLAMAGAVTFVISGMSACKEKGGQGKNPKGTSPLVSTPVPIAEPSGEVFEKADSQIVEARKSELASQTAITINGEPVGMDYAMFWIYQMEQSGNRYAKLSGYPTTEEFWAEIADGEGHTNRDLYLENAQETMIQYEVLYDCAKKKQLTLTANELQNVKAYVEEMKQNLSASEAERGGFGSESLQKMVTEMFLAEKYYESMTQNLGVDKDKVKKTVNPEEYREYKTEYLYMPTTYYNEKYELCQESEEVKQLCREVMESYKKETERGKTLEEIAAKDDSLQCKERKFLVNGNGAETAYAAAAKKLGENEICGPIQTEYGLYLIRMIDNDCKDAYNEAVETAYEGEKRKAFEAAYRVLLESYEIEVTKENWNGVVMGKTVSEN